MKAVVNVDDYSGSAQALAATTLRKVWCDGFGDFGGFGGVGRAMVVVMVCRCLLPSRHLLCTGYVVVMVCLFGFVFVSPKLASCVCWASDNAGSRQ